MTLLRVCQVSDMAPGSVRRFDGGPEAIAVFNVDGIYYATQDRCPHGQWPLSESYVNGDTVECALHSGCFSIRTGKRLGPPVSRALRIYPITINDGVVFVDVTAGGTDGVA